MSVVSAYNSMIRAKDIPLAAASISVASSTCVCSIFHVWNLFAALRHWRCAGTTCLLHRAAKSCRGRLPLSVSSRDDPLFFNFFTTSPLWFVILTSFLFPKAEERTESTKIHMWEIKNKVYASNRSSTVLSFHDRLTCFSFTWMPVNHVCPKGCLEKTHEKCFPPFS